MDVWKVARRHEYQVCPLFIHQDCDSGTAYCVFAFAFGNGIFDETLLKKKMDWNETHTSSVSHVGRFTHQKSVEYLKAFG